MGGTFMSFKRYFAIIFSFYIASMLYGASFEADDLVCLFGSSIWVAVAIIIWQPFKHKKAVDVNGDNE
jgi:EamA domain-containing membrane protein RarD